jgi:Gluconate 2-dehydrogenase subunit 3
MTADNTKQKGACEAPGLTRREAVQRVMALMGGLTLVGEERLFALSVDTASLAQATTHGVGAFTAADVALLDEIADTILPETSTPGAKAARTGAFMALMVTDAYTDRDQQVFRDGQGFHGGNGAAAAHAAGKARPRTKDGDGGTPPSDTHAVPCGGAAGRGRAGALFPHDEGTGTAWLLHVGDWLHAGHALPRGAGTLRSGRSTQTG